MIGGDEIIFQSRRNRYALCDGTEVQFFCGATRVTTVPNAFLKESVRFDVTHANIIYRVDRPRFFDRRYFDDNDQVHVMWTLITLCPEWMKKCPPEEYRQ